MITPDPEPMTTQGNPLPLYPGLLWDYFRPHKETPPLYPGLLLDYFDHTRKNPLYLDYFRITFGLLYKQGKKGTVTLYSKSV